MFFEFSASLTSNCSSVRRALMARRRMAPTSTWNSARNCSSLKSFQSSCERRWANSSGRVSVSVRPVTKSAKTNGWGIPWIRCNVSLVCWWRSSYGTADRSSLNNSGFLSTTDSKASFIMSGKSRTRGGALTAIGTLTVSLLCSMYASRSSLKDAMSEAMACSGARNNAASWPTQCERSTLETRRLTNGATAAMMLFLLSAEVGLYAARARSK